MQKCIKTAYGYEREAKIRHTGFNRKGENGEACTANLPQELPN